MNRVWEAQTVFQFQSPEIIFGPGTVKRTGARAKQYGAARVGVVVDANVVKAGHLKKVLDSLADAGIAADVFDKIEAEPTLDTVREGVAFLKDKAPQTVIALGGGSTLDAAKAIAVVLGDGGEPADYLYGRIQPTKASPPLIAIATTAGTAADISAGAVIGDYETQIKGGFPRAPWRLATAICDPELTLTVPPWVTAYNGMDAIGHAIDSYMNINFHPISDAMDLQVCSLVAEWLPVAVAKGSNLTARSAVMFAASTAGFGFAQRGTALTHGISHPLGVYGHMPHGLTISLLLPAVMEFNLEACAPKLADVAAAMGENIAGLTPREAGWKAVKAVRGLIKAIGLPDRLRDAGVTEEALSLIARDTEKWRKSNTAINPRDASEAQVLELLKRIY